MSEKYEIAEQIANTMQSLRADNIDRTPRPILREGQWSNIN